MPQEADGRHREVVKAVSTERNEAEKAEARLKRGERPESVFGAGFPFERAVSKFLEECRKRVSQGVLDAKTTAGYRSRLNSVLPHFRGRDVRQITRKMVEVYRDDRMRNGHRRIVKRVGDELKFQDSTPLTHAGVNREVSAIRAMFSYLVREGVVKANPALGVGMLKENNRRERCLSEEEIERLLSQCHSRHLRLAVLIALNTGLCRKGCVSLRWEEIDFKGNEIRKVVDRGKEVRIPLTRKLRVALLENPGISGYVIPSTKRPGEPFRVDANIGFETACRRAGIEDFRFHDLRHTFCTWFITRTGDIRTCALILGLSTAYMAARYSHLIDEHAQNQMKKFEGTRQPIREFALKLWQRFVSRPSLPA